MPQLRPQEIPEWFKDVPKDWERIYELGEGHHEEDDLRRTAHLVLSLSIFRRLLWDLAVNE